jgi:hypothetical protein
MLNRETRKAPRLPPDSSTQMTWEDAHHKEQQHTPNNQEWESLKKWWWEENSTGEGGRPTSHMSCK